LAFMSANREPSNQSFDVDREATVCLANRRFFLTTFVAKNPQQRGGVGRAHRLRSDFVTPIARSH
jgi:hypothetical protein